MVTFDSYVNVYQAGFLGILRMEHDHPQSSANLAQSQPLLTCSWCSVPTKKVINKGLLALIISSQDLQTKYTTLWSSATMIAGKSTSWFNEFPSYKAPVSLGISQLAMYFFTRRYPGLRLVPVSPCACQPRSRQVVFFWVGWFVKANRWLPGINRYCIYII